MDKTMITGIVLAGGKSSRMGTDKSLVVWKNKTLLEHAIDLLKQVCGRVVVSSNNIQYDFTGCEIWPDEVQIGAPMIGVYSCLKRSETNTNIVLSCDMPFINTGLLRNLLEVCGNYPVLVPVHRNGLIEPLCGIYRKTLIADLEEHIRNNNLSLYKFIQTYATGYLQVAKEQPYYHENLFANINTPDDLKKLLVG